LRYWNYCINISALLLFSASLIFMVYIPVLKLLGIFQGSENVPSDVIGVFNDIIIWSSSSIISTVRRSEFDCPTPLINTVSPVQILFPQFVMLNLDPMEQIP